MKAETVSSVVISVPRLTHLYLDTAMTGDSKTVQNAVSADKKVPADINCAPKTVTLKRTLLAQSPIAKESKIDKDLQDLYRYLTEKKCTAAEARAVLNHQENIKAAKQKMKVAEQRAVAARKKMNHAIRDSDIANFDLTLAVEEVKEAEELMLFANTRRPYQPTEEGFQKFKGKVLQTEISSEDSE